MKHYCDICGQLLEPDKGLVLKGIKRAWVPWKKKYYICDKCEYVAKRIILGYRKTRPNLL